MIGPKYGKPGRKKTAAPAAPTGSVRSDVIRRDKSVCQWCGGYVSIASEPYSLQHRRARAMGGTSRPEANYAANLVLVHGTGTTGCHSEIEQNPEEATARGFRIRQHQQPDQVPIRCRMPFEGLTWCLLDDDNGKGYMTFRDAAELMRAYGIEVT